MRNFIKVILVSMALLPWVTMEAGNEIKQSFYPGFHEGWSSETPAVSPDGWQYVNLMLETNENHLFNGSTAVLQSGTAENAIPGSVTSIYKEGGIGMVSFWCKPKELYTWADDYEIEVQVSADGETFNTVEVVSLPSDNNTIYRYFSFVINEPAASYVRLELNKQTSSFSYVNLDEIVITDAVVGGTPANVHITSSIDGEVGEEIHTDIAVSATHIYSELTFRFKKGEVFKLADTEVIVPAHQFTDTYLLPVSFIPVQYSSSDTLCISGSGIPEILFPVSGLALSKTLTEGFNSAELPDWASTVTYDGWELVNAYQVTDQNQVYEGEGALCFYSSVTSPRKLDGVGEISFLYRVPKEELDVECIVSTSVDGKNWVEEERFTAVEAQYKRYHKSVNKEDAAYVKIATVGNSYSYNVLIDALVITASGKPVSFVTAEKSCFSTWETPYTFEVPLTLVNITEDLTLSLDNPEFSLAQSTIAVSETSGTHKLTITYLPTSEAIYSTCTINVTQGGLYFPETFDMIVYNEIEGALFTGFDGEWGEAWTTGDFMTDEGWKVTNAQRATNNTFGGSTACAQLSKKSNVISPAKSGGVGMVQFYTLSSGGTAVTVTVSVSEDGENWKEKEGVECTNPEYKNYEVEINSETARYVRLFIDSESSYFTLYVDNITITDNGVGVPRLLQEKDVIFATPVGVEQTVNVPLRIENIASDVNVSLNSGNVFELATNVIPLTAVADNLYELPVSFKPGTEGYFQDSLIFSSPDFEFDIIIPLKGYILFSQLFQDFEGEFVTSGNNSVVDGWEIFMGNRTTNAADVYNGSAALTLNTNQTGGGSILSIPKAEGVGTISFYYKTTATVPVEVKVFTYTSLSESPAEVHTFEVMSTPAYTLKEIVVNDPDAVYVKIELTPATMYASVILDYLIITASGKGVPGITAPQEVFLMSGAGEEFAKTIEITTKELTESIMLSFLNGANFKLDNYEFSPKDNEGNVILTLTCLPDEGTFYYADTLIINSEELIKPVTVMVEGHVLKDELLEGFNEEFTGTEASTLYNGWLLKDGKYQSKDMGNPLYVKEGEGSLNLSFSSIKNGSLRSPAKSGGVNRIEFYYLGTTSMEFAVEVSEDGEVWNVVDKVTTPSLAQYQFYQKQIGNSEAKFIRIRGGEGSYPREVNLYIDSVFVDAVPHIRLAEEVIRKEVTDLPVTIKLDVAGYLTSPATLSMLEPNSLFEILSPVITPGQVADGGIVSVELQINSLPGEGDYNDALVITNEEFEDLIYLPVYITYTPSSKEPEPENETTILECDFEETEQVLDWKTFDLDGRILVNYGGNREGWFRSYEIDSEEENIVFMASSFFTSNTQYETYPADDWLFSLPLAIPARGNYQVSWDARSLMELFPEDYEVRIIEDETLQALENSFTEDMLLSEISAILVENTDLLLSVKSESAVWVKRKINLNPYKGKNIRVIWRYISDDKNAIYIDNFRYYSSVLGGEFTQLPGLIGYTQVPSFTMEDFDRSVKAAVSNGVDEELTHVEITLSMHDETGNELLVMENQQVAQLTSYQSVEIATESDWNLLENDHYYKIEVVADGDYKAQFETEVYTGVVLTENTYAWDTGLIEGGVYTTSVGFQVGQRFPIEVDSYLTSITFALTANTTSTSVHLHVYEMKGEERVLLTSVNSVAVTPQKADIYTVKVPGENILLEAGKTYFFAVEPRYEELLFLAKEEGRKAIAAYYTTNNAEWIELEEDHILFLRVNVQKEKDVSVRTENEDTVTVQLTKEGYLQVSGLVPGSSIALYNTGGYLLFNAEAGNSSEKYAVELPNGVYLVKVNNKTYKVVR